MTRARHLRVVRAAPSQDGREAERLRVKAAAALSHLTAVILHLDALGRGETSRVCTAHHDELARVLSKEVERLR